MDRTMRELLERIADLERRLENVVRPVRVTANEGGGRVRVTDGAGFDPEPVPQMSVSAGNWKIDAPADAGTAGILFSPGGDPSLARFMPTNPWDDHPAASETPSRMRLAGPGGETITIDGGTAVIDMPDRVTVKAPRATVESEDVRLGGSGGRPVARIGDRVAVSSGSSAGNWPIVEGSSVVTAVD